MTVNPDFGEVEVDSAEVNLTAFETFFSERRPFFVEGSDLFTFGRSRALNNFGVPTVFHSRRIGRSPQLALGGPGYGFVDAPEQTTIAGAAKLTGRTAGGWRLGRSMHSRPVSTPATSTRSASSARPTSNRRRTTSPAVCDATCATAIPPWACLAPP